jgi:serine/threonine protein phosphatase PrpC
MSDRPQAPSSDQETDGILLKLFGRTDVGQIREHNEDNFLIADLTRQRRSLTEEDRVQAVGTRGTALGVCDGMGGAAAGEVASQLAVDIIYERLVEGEPPPNNDELARRLVGAIEDAGVRIYNEARADRTRRGMGTTATVAVLMGPRMFVGQVGDSRAYVMREGELIQVTRDQSLVNQLIEAGQLTEEEAETFEHNNIILQALGTAETVQVDLTYVDLCRGDTLLLCSDGLSGMVRASEIRDVLLEVPDPFEACTVLTERANLAGGHDNITVIVAHVSGDALPEPDTVGPPVYQKYALPETPASEPAVRETPPQSDSIQTGPISEEAPRESRRLKVGHTVVATPSPPAAAAPPPSEPPATLPSSIPPPHSDAADEAVELPTTGLPPRLVGMLILGSLLLVAALGFWLLR